MQYVTPGVQDVLVDGYNPRHRLPQDRQVLARPRDVLMDPVRQVAPH